MTPLPGDPVDLALEVLAPLSDEDLEMFLAAACGVYLDRLDGVHHAPGYVEEAVQRLQWAGRWRRDLLAQAEASS